MLAHLYLVHIGVDDRHIGIQTRIYGCTRIQHASHLVYCVWTHGHIVCVLVQHVTRLSVCDVGVEVLSS